MSAPADRGLRGLGLGRDVTIAVDRVACTGHGVCAQVLAPFRLDEWGYPIVDDPHVHPDDADVAIKLCPARALYRR
jgi:ferredoxin